MMRRLLDPNNTVAVILGAHDWTKAGLPKAESFRRSAEACHKYMLKEFPYGLGLQPGLILNLFDDASAASTQLISIRETIEGRVKTARDAGTPLRDLLIYYIGHGTCESGKQLHLLVRDSRKGIEEQSGIGTRDLASVLRVAAPQQRRLLILDCCFSEAAVADFDAMGPLEEAVAATALRDLEQAPSPERGTLLLCSSPRNRVSIGAPNGDRTLFTGSLLRVLTEGSVSHTAELLSFADLRDAVWDKMLTSKYGSAAPRPALHQPDQSEGDLTRVPAFPNVALSMQAGQQLSTVINEPIERDAPRTPKSIIDFVRGGFSATSRRKYWLSTAISLLLAVAVVLAFVYKDRYIGAGTFSMSVLFVDENDQPVHEGTALLLLRNAVHKQNVNDHGEVMFVEIPSEFLDHPADIEYDATAYSLKTNITLHNSLRLVVKSKSNAGTERLPAQFPFYVKPPLHCWNRSGIEDKCVTDDGGISTAPSEKEAGFAEFPVPPGSKLFEAVLTENSGSSCNGGSMVTRVLFDGHEKKRWLQQETRRIDVSIPISSGTRSIRLESTKDEDVKTVYCDDPIWYKARFTN